MRFACALHKSRGILCGLIVACGSPALWGASGGAISLPLGGKPPVNGLALVMDTAWAEGRGYRPVRIEVKCTPPSVADRTLEVELGMIGWPGRNVGWRDGKYLTVAAEIEIPAGSKSVTKVISVPQYTMGQSISLDVWEDQVHLDDLSIEAAGMNSSNSVLWGGDVPVMLFVSKADPDLGLFGFFGQGNANGTVSTGSVGAFAHCMADKLVEGWLNYSSLDVIWLSRSDLLDLVIRRPKVWRSLCDWTQAGGNLCVFGVGKDWGRLAELERLLQLTKVDESAPGPYHGWQPPDAESYGQPFNVSQPIASPYQPQATLPADAPEDAPKFGEVKKRIANGSAPFVTRSAMLGTVAALASDDPFPGETSDWKWLFDTLSAGRWKWRFRHGATLDNVNAGFDNLLIGDIGLPPVRSYRVLISLFVVLIGPINYWWLRRQGRLHLLLFTVPAAALLVTGGLLGYVFLADGLQAIARTRSYTELDQRNHQAVGWARLSYYTGMAPSNGLLFPADTAIIPLERSSAWDAWSGKTHSLAWTPEQHLQRGWLPSRTPTQYVTVRPYASGRELTVLEQDGEPPKVKNQLGVAIRHLVLCDSAGKLYFDQQIDAGTQKQLPALDSDAAADKAARAYVTELTKNAPALPDDAVAPSQSIFGARNRMIYRGGMYNADQPDTADSLFEQAIKKIVTDLASNEMPKRTYAAIVERPAEIVLGIPGLAETQSLHVIFGHW